MSNEYRIQVIEIMHLRPLEENKTKYSLENRTHFLEAFKNIYYLQINLQHLQSNVTKF